MISLQVEFIKHRYHLSKVKVDTILLINRHNVMFNPPLFFIALVFLWLIKYRINMGIDNI